MHTLLQDLRYSWRTLRTNLGFTIVAVIALALGIGANSAIFTVVNALLLRPLPFSQPDQLVQVWEANLKQGRSKMVASYPNFVDWRDQNRVFEQIAAYSDYNFNLTGTGQPERLRGAIVSPAFFSLLGIKPILGRVLLPTEDHPKKVFTVVIGERLWKRHFNSNPQIIGQAINLNNESFTVVGVIPQVSDLLALPNDTEVWASISHSYGFENRRGHYLGVLARLKPGVTIEQAQANMDVIGSALARQYPDANPDRGVLLVPLHEQIVGGSKLALWVLLGAVVCVLLIASANVANMLLARAASRQKEIAIRTALGAGRFRLVRQLLTESLLLSALGGALGLLLALWGVDLLRAFGPAELPRIEQVAVDGRVLAFTLAVSWLTGIIFGLVPALQASRPDLNEALKESGRSASGSAGRRRLRSLLVVTEIALSLVLLVGAGLLIRSFINLRAVNPGFNTQNVLTMQLDLSGPKYEKAAPVIAFYDQLLGKIKTLPGVQSVAARSHTPIVPNGAYARLSFLVEGRQPDPANRPVAYYEAVSSEYFQAMEIPVLKGRAFDPRDTKQVPYVIIINETLARRYFPGEDPIGKRMTLNDDNPKEEEWATIVGLVKDTKPRELEKEATPEMYMPLAQLPESSMTLMIRTTTKPESIAAAVRAEVLSLDPNQPVYSIRTMENVISEAVATPRFRTFLLGVFAVVALILAMVGVYGVMSYSVTQRTHEIGIRVALGAQSSDVLKLVVGQGMALACAGVGIGLIASFALTRVMSKLLFGVEPTDLLTFAVIALLLTGVALLACYLPARRAMKVDPMIALRYE